MLLKYIVHVAGGLGPHVWDDQFTIEANGFETAFALAKQRAEAECYQTLDWDFVCIEQID